MAQPPEYTRTKNFTDDFGSETDHSALNAELDRASNSINDIRHNLAILQADDGKLRPNVVTYDSLSNELIESISADVRADVQGELDRAEAAAESAEADANRAEQATQNLDYYLTQSGTHAQQAKNSAEEAYQFANNPVGQIVNSTAHPNNYSAFHYAKLTEEMLNSVQEPNRGTYYNAFEPEGTVYEIDTVTVEDGGTGYSVGNVAAILTDPAETEYPAWVIVDSVDENGTVVSVSLSSVGIFNTSPADNQFETNSDGGTGLYVSVTFTSGAPTTLNDIDNPQPNQTATVLHNERMGGNAWIFVYADRNDDGIYNWIEQYQIAGGEAIPDDGEYITSEGGIRTLTQSVKEKLNDTEIPSGTQMLFIQSTAPTGWTKVTDHNDKALRIVSGDAGTGGSLAFSSAFASRAVTGTIGATTLALSQIPSHIHASGSALGYASPGYDVGYGWNGGAGYSGGAVNVGAWAGGSGSHTHSFTGTALNFSVQYVDAIIAMKD